MGKAAKDWKQRMIKVLGIPGIALTLTVCMGSMAMGIDDGTYDFYGTFSTESYFADGVGTTCASELNNMTCPSTAKFCIKNLDVTSNVITSNETAIPYGIAIEIMDGLVDADYDGTGPVSLTVGASSADDVLASIDVDSTSGGCAGAAAVCVNSYDKDMEAPGGDAATVTGEIPVLSNLDPTTYPLCSGGSGSYGGQIVTSETAESRVSNENGANQTLSVAGAGLSGSDPTYSLKLVTPEAVMRTTIGPIVVETDVHAFKTFDGTLCRRTFTDTSCIPGGFTCPAEDD